ncbi:hypothetical protein MPER_03780, partial [Moniliophthora perniciosa FA553]
PAVTREVRAFDARPSKPTLPSPSKKYPVQLERVTRPSSPRKRLRYPPTPISHLPVEWKAVKPTDKELILYLRWRWAHLERMDWSPETGETRA